jgi:SET domain-containing protein
MLLIKTSLRQSAIHGLGCFTEENIRKGQLVWEYDERVDLHLPVRQVAEFPMPFQDFLSMYGYTEMRAGEKVVILCGDHSRHINHSESPNLSDTPAHSIALRDIEAGEELTCDYRSFDLDTEQKLNAELAARS